MGGITTPVLFSTAVILFLTEMNFWLSDFILTVLLSPVFHIAVYFVGLWIDPTLGQVIFTIVISIVYYFLVGFVMGILVSFLLKVIHEYNQTRKNPQNLNNGSPGLNAVKPEG